MAHIKLVLGGTAASHTCSGMGGGHFLIRTPIRRFVARADEKLAALLDLEAAGLPESPKMNHRWPQCEARSLIMKLEIRPARNGGFGS